MYCPACHAEYPADWKACPKDATTLLKSAQIGKYKIEGLLGVGGMGAVYRAVNPDIKGARVAIKVMNPAVAGAEATRERFKREAAAVAALRTSHVVKVYDFSAEPDGTLYLVMELLDGHPLRDEIQPAPNYMDLARVQMVMTGALKGLAAAHKVGIVHRDLKPENIYVADTDDGEVPKLLDFGIARVRSTDKNLTHTGSLMGTASYMATEQIAAGVAEIGPWSDVYAMGAILYEMLAGAPAFGGTTITEVLQRVLKAEHVPLHAVRPGLPPAVYDLVARCMSPDPAQRPQNADQMRQALTAARLVPPGAPVPPPIKTRVDASPPSQISGVDARNHSDVAIAKTEGRDTPIPATVAAYDSRPNVIPGYGGAAAHGGSQPNLVPGSQPGLAPGPIVPGDAAASQPALQVAGTGPGIASGTGPVGDSIDRAAKKRSPLPFVLGGLGLAGAAVVAIVVATSGSSDPQPDNPVATHDAGTPPPPVDAAVQVAELDAAVAEPLPGFTATMVHFEAGSHELGEDPLPNPNALPKRRHDVAEFWLDKHELTLAEVRAALGSKSAGGLRGDAPNLPARNVSWDQAAATCRALGKRLPTELEWEVAARTAPRDPGKAALCQACPKSKPVLRASTPADCSADGLCDMLGGVIEWTADSIKDGKVVRGSSYTVSPAAGWQASIAFRAVVPPAADAEVGLRCAWSKDTPTAPPSSAATTGGTAPARAASAPPAPRPKPAAARCQVDELEQAARDAAARKQYGKALQTAQRGLGCAPDDPALRRIAALAACRMKNVEAARRHIARLRPKDRNRLRQICVSSGVQAD